MSASETPSSARSVAVLGAGVSGLAAALRLADEGHTPTVFEARTAPGGVIRTRRRDGFQVDVGANSMQARPPLVTALVERLGLAGAVATPGEAAQNRYIVRDGQPVAAPSSPPGVFTTKLFSLPARLRLLAEPLVRRGADPDESIAAFVRRRLGPQVLDYAVDPFVGGIFAGDPEQLSLRHAFPRLHDLEQTYGSLLRGAAGAAKAKKADASGSNGADSRPSGAKPPASFSFHGGMQTLPDALAAALPPSALRYAHRVRSLDRPADEADGGAWTVTVETDGQTHTERFDGVVCTLPLHRLPEIAWPATADVTPLAAVTYAPVALLGLGFRRADVAHPLDGFGMLVPSREPYALLGALFSSSLFPGRAPEGHVLLTCFAGGMRHPAHAAEATDALLGRLLPELEALLGVRGAPALVERHTWTHAIPQYHVGYDRVLDALADLEARHPGLRFAGNFRQGVSVGDALASGWHAAATLAR